MNIEIKKDSIGLSFEEITRECNKGKWYQTKSGEHLFYNAGLGNLVVFANNNFGVTNAVIASDHGWKAHQFTELKKGEVTIKF